MKIVNIIIELELMDEKNNIFRRIVRIFTKNIKYKIKYNQLLSSALTSTKPITQLLKDGEIELIVSLTTYNKRIHDVHLVVESIARQTVKPHRLLLWLDEEEFSMNSIPPILHKQIKRGLEVYFYPNYRSYKKLIPALTDFPEANIITIDDDILYPDEMIEILLDEHNLFPRYILGHRAHKIRLNSNNELLPYNEWEYETQDSEASDFIFLTSGGGTLYPACSFNKEVLNCDAFLELCPHADDVWFKAMSLLNSVKCKKVQGYWIFSDYFLPLRGSQDIALFKYNVDKGGNDTQLKAVFDKYGLFDKIINRLN